MDEEDSYDMRAVDVSERNERRGKSPCLAMTEMSL
jgi:hypothetical protein